MNFKIRRCMVSDAKHIYELCRLNLGYDFSQQQVEANIRKLIGSPENLLMVAVDEDDECIGFVHANNHDPVYAPPMKDIMALAVYDEYRHKGIGKQLVAAVENWAKQTGASGLRTNSSIDQKNAVAFYKACGFDNIRTLYNLRKMF